LIKGDLRKISSIRSDKEIDKEGLRDYERLMPDINIMDTEGYLLISF